MKTHNGRQRLVVGSTLAGTALALFASHALAWKHRGEGWWQSRVEYKINNQCSQYQGVVTNAANCWNIKPALTLVNGGLTSTAACQEFLQSPWRVPLCAPMPPDGVNVIDWCLGARDGDTLAETFSVTVMNADGTCCRTESDICIYFFFCDNHGNDEPINWHTGAGAPPAGAFDMESVLKHEFGHFVGLNHTCFAGPPRPVMWDSIAPGVRRRRLRADDIAGFCDLYVGNRQPQWRAAGNPYMGDPPRKLLALEGTVNATGDELADVIFTNGSAGNAADRSLDIPQGAPIAIDVASPPSRQGLTSPYSIYVWNRKPTDASATDQVAGPGFLGISPFPTPLNRGATPQPFKRTNNTGIPALGTSNFPSGPAPFSFVRRQGLNRPICLTVAGIIRDDAAGNPSGFSCMNGIVLQIR